MRSVWVGLSCLIVAGCVFSNEQLEIDVTPDTASGGALIRLEPPTAVPFDGTPTRIGFEPIPLEGGDFKGLMDFAFLPGGQELLAVNRQGLVGHFVLERNRATLRASFNIPAIYTGGDCAASSIALDPSFESNKLFYVSYCIDEQYNVIKRYTMSDDDFGETLYSAANVLATGDPKTDIPRRAIGTVTFGPDGVLWANIGDRGREANAQDLTNELGKVIRLKPLLESNVSGFTAPERNMFTSQDPGSKLVYAYGFQNPRRGAFDALGRYWVADDGAHIEEINIVTKPGQNFGWSNAEGVACKTGSCSTYVPPVRTWDTSFNHRFVLEDPLAKEDSEYRAAWVGIEYQPGKQDRYKGLLTGRMLYGDFYLGFVRGAIVNPRGIVTDDRHLGHIDLPVAWRQGLDGYLYVGTMYESFDRTRELQGDANLVPQARQGMLWRVVPLP